MTLKVFMFCRLANFFKLIQIIRERGNWPLIRRSKNQLRDFVFCRSSLNKKNLLQAAGYWIFMLKGLDVLVWRLETFGFLYSLDHDDESKQNMNRNL